MRGRVSPATPGGVHQVRRLGMMTCWCFLWRRLLFLALCWVPRSLAGACTPEPEKKKDFLWDVLEVTGAVFKHTVFTSRPKKREYI